MSATKKPSIKKTVPVAKKTASAPAGEKKAKRTRKPAMERAQKLTNLLVKKYSALAKAAGRWGGECTPEQRTAVVQITTNLGEMRSRVDDVAADIAFLNDSGFAPTAGSPGRKPLADGTMVKLKDKRFDAEVHGEINLFKVVSKTEKYFRLVNGAGDVAVSVPRAWFDPIDSADVAADVDGEPETDIE